MRVNYIEIKKQISNLKLKQFLENLSKNLKKSFLEIKEMINNEIIVFLIKKSDYIHYQLKNDYQAYKFYL